MPIPPQPWEIALYTMRYKKMKRYKDKESCSTDSLGYANVQEKITLKMHVETKY